ncbi:MAG: restriction endonuclease [Nanoarchaeota archaeon]|nr:restriction endonuclease [Nanoarchaeota archaeon]
MVNTFSELEDRLFYEEEIIFDFDKIKNFIFEFVQKKLEKEEAAKRGFLFEQVICDFFDYLGVDVVLGGKTRDFGLDGIVRLNLDVLGEVDLGLQAKYKLIDSNDVDLFLASLKNAELQLGVIVCEDSRQLQKYELNSKISAILFAKGIKIKEKVIKENININPIFVLKMDDVVEMSARKFRNVVEAVYKK